MEATAPAPSAAEHTAAEEASPGAAEAVPAEEMAVPAEEMAVPDSRCVEALEGLPPGHS